MVAGFPALVELGDLNGDALPDLVVDVQKSFCVGLGNGDGTFDALACTPGGGGYAITLGDANGDGNLDLFRLKGGHSMTLEVHLGHGDGTFSAPVSSPTVDCGGYSGHCWLAVGDSDGDGTADVAGPDEALLGNGDGSFREGPGHVHVPTLSALADLDGDGLLDIAGGWVLLGRGDGSFREAPDYRSGGDTRL